jgi:arabinose-5-phosphate isomerase
MTSPVAFDAGRALALARDTLIIEAEAVQALTARIDAAFAGALQCLLACRGRVVVMGMGKSGHIGRKLAATLASTGTPSQFVHPAEASHGDLGMITPQDVVLAISNSGESDELTVLLPLIKRMGVPLVAFTGRAESALARHADWVLDTAVAREACPHNLAPTASTTAQLALGDALAVALLDARGFRADDFARSHPGGSLGRRLLTHVSDVMRQGEAVPRVAPATPLMDLMREISAKGLGLCAVVGDDGRALGVFTDGDLRRLIERTGSAQDLRLLTAEQVMYRQPATVAAQSLAVEAARQMEERRINSLLVVDADGLLVGALSSNDLMRAKVI